MNREARGVKSEQEARARIATLAAADVGQLCVLAGEIWRRHYADIISPAQIEYMLEQRYSPAVVIAELQRSDLWWDQLLVDNRMAGFTSYFLTGKAGEMKVDKLYVHHAIQRMGYGRMLLERAVTAARSHGCRTLILAVNKNNRNALAAYAKYGFRVAESVVKDIGSGFVMDDYIMRKDV